MKYDLEWANVCMREYEFILGPTLGFARDSIGEAAHNSVQKYVRYPVCALTSAPVMYSVWEYIREI